MKESIRPRYEARAKILKAMAHPSRLLIIEELQKQERCVNELTEMVGADTSTVSKHLSVLKNAGLVTVEKEGQLHLLHPALHVHSRFYRLRGGCACRESGRSQKNYEILQEIGGCHEN
ncbi:MAG: metalloregulator ArsR/SmtB family transcription factor [Desulfobacterales bacterium]|nr:metalloregulator ArsR/SmtB family transcription factor [Desulfobacterales bacterium]